MTMVKPPRATSYLNIEYYYYVNVHREVFINYLRTVEFLTTCAHINEIALADGVERSNDILHVQVS